MRILFACELGSVAENFHLMKIVAAELRARLRRCEIVVATSLKAKDVDLSWADAGYSTPKFTFRHDSAGDGVIQQLHYLGWTTDELRKIQFNNWRSLLEQVEPNLVVCTRAPGAVIVATMLGYKCLTLETEPYIALESSLTLFPELNAWAEDMVGLGIEGLLNRPGIAFLSALGDASRSTMMLNASPFEGVSLAPTPGPPLLVMQGKDDALQLLEAHLDASGWKPHKIDAANLYTPELLPGLSNSHPAFVVGSYDSASTSLALTLGVPYLGLPLSDLAKQQAAQLEAIKRSFRITSDPVMVDFLLDSMPGLQRDAAERHRVDRGGFCALDTALDMVL